MHEWTDVGQNKPKAICPFNFSKVEGIKTLSELDPSGKTFWICAWLLCCVLVLGTFSAAYGTR